MIRNILACGFKPIKLLSTVRRALLPRLPPPLLQNTHFGPKEIHFRPHCSIFNYSIISIFNSSKNPRFLPTMARPMHFCPGRVFDTQYLVLTLRMILFILNTHFLQPGFPEHIYIHSSVHSLFFYYKIHVQLLYPVCLACFFLF